jgi:DNA-directed RNA polymerase subunit beta'
MPPARFSTSTTCPAKARIEVLEGQEIKIGQMLARQPQGRVPGSADIVGGLPRVTEIFEARTPKDPAVTAEISGKVELHSATSARAR